MSRIILSRHSDGSEHVVVGWDHPARGAFWTEYASPVEVFNATHAMEKAEKTGIGPHSETVSIVETGCKREGGMWPGIPLDKLVDSMPSDLRPLMTDQVMTLLKQHSTDPDSGYVGSPNRGVTDLTVTVRQPTAEQDKAIGELNDMYGVANWEFKGDDAMLTVTLDDDTIAHVSPMGNWEFTK